MATGRILTLLFGVVLAFAAGTSASPKPEVDLAGPRELVDGSYLNLPCVVVSEVSISVPCPCVEGDSGITVGFTLTNGRRHHHT